MSYRIDPRVVVLAAGCLLAGLTPARVTAQDFNWQLSLGGTRGDYGLEETVGSLVLDNRLGYYPGDWFVEVSVPVIAQDAVGVAWVGGMPMRGRQADADDGGHGGGGGGHGGGGGGHGGGGGGGGGGGMHHDPALEDRGSSTGIGDPIARAGFAAYRSVAGTSRVDVFATVKAPLADEDDGFSTGEWDVGAGVGWYAALAALNLSLELTYWRLGQPPEVELEDPVLYRLAVSRRVGSSPYLIEGLAFGHSETLAGSGAAHSLGVGGERLLDSGGSLFLDLSAGVSDAAPEVTAVAGLRLSF